MAKQTALDWFIEKVMIQDTEYFAKEIAEAKQMEKQQIREWVNTYISGEDFSKESFDKVWELTYGENK